MSDQPDAQLDPDLMRERYRAERDKRIRSDGADQYFDLSGPLASFGDNDPHVAPGFERDAVHEEPDVVIVGGGFSGLLSAARLTAERVDSFRIVEAGGDFGGTWYWNRYPGAQCDTDAYCYLPLLEELGYMPSEKYSHAPEILEHSQRIGEQFGLYDRALLQTRVESLRWDDTLNRWIVKTNRGDELRARFVIMALGTISRPKLPGVPGITDFEGRSFHTSRWDYDYTGGDSSGGMDRLTDKRVAVIGTGATSIQIVPKLAHDAQHLYVFQRTPSTVGLRLNEPTDAEWFESLQPGWQRERRENFADFAMGRRPPVDLVDDSWTSIFRAISSPKGADRPATREERARVVELQDLMKMEELRGRVDDVVEDPAVAEALKPWYRVMCKRPTFNDDYLPAFNRPNVTLVDVSDSKGIERISPTGVVVGGVNYEVDLIVYASGYQTGSGFKLRLGIDTIEGRNGVSLYDHWGNGQRTLHGFMTRGFPNWFYVGVSQNAFSVNMTSMFDEQARHVAHLIGEANRRGATVVEPSEAGEAGWCDLIAELSPSSGGFLAQCTPGYYNQEGATSANSFLGAYTPGLTAFSQLLEGWRATGELDGLELTVPTE